MQQPFDYTLKGLQDPSASFMQGFERATAFKALEAQRAMEAQYQSDLANVSSNPSVQGIKYLMTRYPAQAEKFKSILANMTEEQRAAKLNQLNSIYAPLVSGRKDISLSNLSGLMEAASNSGDKAFLQQLGTIKGMLESDQTGPAGDSMVNFGLGMFLASAMGPEKYAENYSKLNEAAARSAEMPTKLARGKSEAGKAASEAQIKGVEAKYAESKAIADLEKAKWDVNKIKNDMEVSNQNLAINRAQLKLAQSSNAMQAERLRMDRDEAIAKRDARVRELASEAQTAMSTTEQISDLTKWLKAPEQASDRQSATGMISWTLPGYSSRTYANRVEQLTNILAAGNLDKLKGAMSDKDIVFLKGISANLNRDQDEAGFLRELKRLDAWAESKLRATSDKYGAPVRKSFTQKEVEDLARKRGVTSNDIIAEVEGMGGRVRQW